MVYLYKKGVHRYDMNRITLAICLVVIASLTAIAQDAGDDHKAGEIFIGYSNGQVDTGLGDLDDELGLDIGDRESFHGFNVSGVVNVNRYFGIKGDVSGVYSNRGFAFTVPAPGGGTGSVSFETKSSLYNFLGGVQVKDNSKSGTFKPFAHALVGAAHTRVKLSGLGCSVGIDCSVFQGGSETNFAGAFGGGIDIRLNNRVQVRVIQVDYNPIWFDGGRQNNVRFGFGIVF
jgi:opacity protein-like surface antigen